MSGRDRDGLLATADRSETRAGRRPETVADTHSGVSLPNHAELTNHAPDRSPTAQIERDRVSTDRRGHTDERTTNRDRVVVSGGRAERVQCVRGNERECEREQNCGPARGASVSAIQR